MEETGPKGSSSIARMRVALIRRFPDHAAMVERLFEDCERFRELCADYLECGKVLQRFEERDDTTQHKAYTNYVRERTDEYKELQSGLEQEMLECIEDRATCRHCGRKHGQETVEH